MEALVVVDCHQEKSRGINFTYSWGKSCYKVRIDNTIVPVYTPLLRSPGHGKQYQFQLPSGDETVATIDGPPSVAIHVNDYVVARITPTLTLSPIKFGLSSYPLQVAAVSIGEESLPLICSVYYGVASNHFRILNNVGSRMCYWKKTGGWGTGNATLLISRCVHSNFISIAISATLLSLFHTPSGS
jgi:hypothetical protein